MNVCSAAACVDEGVEVAGVLDIFYSAGCMVVMFGLELGSPGELTFRIVQLARVHMWLGQRVRYKERLCATL